jgi:hypothetical protein
LAALTAFFFFFFLGISCLSSLGNWSALGQHAQSDTEYTQRAAQMPQ